jgi:hypothetical protein
MKCAQCRETFSWDKFTDLVQKKSQLCTACWDKPFPITSVCRADLQEILSGSAIARLNDGDMQEIARKMANAYCENVFWIDLEIIAEFVLDKQKDQERRKKIGGDSRLLTAIKAQSR